MAIYRISRLNAMLSIGTLLILSSILILLAIIYSDLMLIMCGIGLALIALVLKIASPMILTDSIGIKVYRFNRIQSECEWCAVYKVETFKQTSSLDHHITWLHCNKGEECNGDFDLPRREVKLTRTIVITGYFDQYVEILKKVKERAIHAEIDSNTEDIISSG